MIALGNEPIPVWPYGGGKQRGISFEPLYKTAPIAALRDPSFYAYLALADAMRDGRARERKIAERRAAGSGRRVNDSNPKQLTAAARLPLLDELVFVGGTVTGLLITDEPPIRDPRAM